MVNLFSSILCKLGVHEWVGTDDVFFVHYPNAMFSQQCKHCGVKALLRCWNFGWAGREQKRETVESFDDFRCDIVIREK